MADAAETFDLQISEYGPEIIVNAGMTDMESSLRGEDRKEEFIVAPSERNRPGTDRGRGGRVLRAPDHQE
jgi:hypothetical protein